LRPIVLRGIRIQTSSAAPVRIDVSADDAVFALNLKGILLRTRGRTLRTLAVHGLRVQFHRNKPGSALTEDTWNTLHRLLPESFELQSSDIRIEDGPTVIMLRSLALTGTPVEAGRFDAGEVV